MTVVDTSVRVDYFNGHNTKYTDTLHDLLGSQVLLIGDLILTEVLQGFQQDSHFEAA